MKPTWKKYLLYASAVIIGGGLLFILIRLILTGYSVTWTGFGEYTLPNGDFIQRKKLWDWMELLIIPLVLAGGALFLQRSERAVERRIADERIQEDRRIAEERSKLEREIAADRQQEAALQAYIDRMAELLLNGKLTTSKNDEARNVARVRTLTLLRSLDGKRRAIALKFLYEANLMVKESTIVDLRGANLTDVKLLHEDLRNINMPSVDIIDAVLIGTNFQGANMSGATLANTNIGSVNFTGADLTKANLQSSYVWVDARDLVMQDANLTEALLTDLKLEYVSLRGANLQRAHLEHINLQNADLRDADLRGAYMLGANLQAANLKKCGSP